MYFQGTRTTSEVPWLSLSSSVDCPVPLESASQPRDRVQPRSPLVALNYLLGQKFREIRCLFGEKPIVSTKWNLIIFDSRDYKPFLYC